MSSASATLQKTTTLLAQITHWIENTPAAPALRLGKDVITYGELGAMADASRTRLVAVAQDEVCGVSVPKTPEGIALLLACLQQDLRFIVTSGQLGKDAFERSTAAAGCTYQLTLDTLERCEPADPERYANHPPGNFVLSTSGSTGEPKVVPLPRESVDNFVAWAASRFDITEATSVLSYAPLNFDLSLLDIWATLTQGGCVVLISPEEAIRPERIYEAIVAGKVEIVQAVPLCFTLLAELGHVAPSVRTLVFTGDVMPAPILRQLPDLFPQATMHNVYGCTETNDSLVYDLDPDLLDSAAYQSHGSLPIGKPVAGVEIRIVPSGNSDALTPTALTPTEGELLVSTPFAAHGYLDPAMTSERFALDPESGTDRFFRSGDLVRVDEGGLLWLVGRRDSQVKIRGVAVVTKDVEQVLLGHPDIDEAAVCVATDERWGKKLVAVVTSAPSAGLNSLTIRGYCAKHLPRSAIPTEFEIRSEPLPRLPNHKVDYRRLRNEIAESKEQ